MNERSALGGGSSRKGGGPIKTLIDLVKNGATHRSPGEESQLRDRVTQLYIRAELLRLTGVRARAATRSGGNPGPEGSVGKLAQSSLYMDIWECCSDAIGDDALVYEPGYELRQHVGALDRRQSAKYQLLRSRANSIEGGTSDIMRNILGERVLGLPGEPRVDKEIPWKDVPRG
jgi:alkylation response protein AidB-like acyl-CoA dehydrogenase